MGKWSEIARSRGFSDQNCCIHEDQRDLCSLMPSNIAHPSSDARSAAEDILSLIAVVIEIREGLCSARDGLKNIDEFAGTELHRQLLQIDEVWIPTQDDQPIA